MRSLKFLLSLLTAIPAAAQDPVIASIVDAVEVDSLIGHLERLSGEESVNVGGGPEFITSRNKYEPGNALAAQWLQQQFSMLGYTPVVQAFDPPTGENVYAIKPGLVHPDRYVIICGHYDAMPGGPVAAPAADDDGSGTVAVLEAARVFANHDFENSVLFACWDEEEQGKVGSAFFAGAAAANDDTVLAVINVDAIAWDGDGDDLMRVHTKPIANSIALKDSAVMANAAYGINLPMAINNPGATYSDHDSFWDEGFGAILIIEDFDDDPNPHYHTSTDLIQYLDLPYFARLTQLALATTAVMAVPVGGNTAIADRPAPGVVMRVHPNPASGYATLWMDGPRALHGAITVTDAIGRVLVTMHEGPFPAGKRSFEVPLDDLAPGSYRIVMRTADGFIASTGLVRAP